MEVRIIRIEAIEKRRRPRRNISSFLWFEQGNELIETCDSRRRRILGKAIIAVKQNGVDPSRHCPFYVFSQTVAEVPGAPRFDRLIIQRGLKDRRVGFSGADASRDANGIEEMIESAGPQHVIQPRVEVGYDAQPESPAFQICQRRRDVVVNAPELATAKPLEDFVKELAEPRKRAETCEDRFHETAPPALLKLGQRGLRGPGGKSQRRLAPKRTFEV